VTQPRLPCFKLGMRFESDDMKERFLQSLRTGFYFGVIREGEVTAGDAIERIAQDPIAVPVSEITRLYITKTYREDDLASLQRALCVAALPESWKDDFQSRLEKLNVWTQRKTRRNQAGGLAFHDISEIPSLSRK
jgi:MOSC domain-containing protein YiiM